MGRGGAVISPGVLGLAAGGFGGSCGLGIFAGEVHDLVTAFPLGLFHGVHHGVIVALMGVEDFSPLFADFRDGWIVIHDLGLQRVQWACKSSERGIHDLPSTIRADRSFGRDVAVGGIRMVDVRVSFFWRNVRMGWCGSRVLWLEEWERR